MKWNGREDELVLKFLGERPPIHNVLSMILVYRRLEHRERAQDQWEAQNRLAL